MIKLTAGTMFLALSMAAHAGPIVVDLTLDGNFAPPDYVFYSYTDMSGQAQDNVPVDPYITYLNGGGYDNTLVYSFCYDFNSPTDVGTPYAGSFETFTDTATLESTYLMNELYGMGLTNVPLDARGAIAFAIWEIMNPSSDTSLADFPTNPASLSYENEAATAVANGSWTAADSALYPTWVPQDPSVQRFGIVFTSSPAVPEPASMVLMGLGLVGLGLAPLRRRRRLTGSASTQSPQPLPR